MRYGAFNGVKVFAATLAAHREALGERVMHWLAEHPQLQLVDVAVLQSSDDRFHCLSIVVFYFDGGAPA